MPINPVTRRSKRALVRLTILLWVTTLTFVWTASAKAQGIESVVSPGTVIQGHAKLNNDCKQCHVKFDRGAQDGLCMDCHKEVREDVKSKNGFHGKSKPQNCRSCHTDHKGSNAKIVNLDTKAFDHNLTDFGLRGKHQTVACEKCHEPQHKYRDAALECKSCHAKDDVHKGELGSKCADCHSENLWKPARFDHSKTRFALTQKHVDVKCTQCHKGNNYTNAPLTCVACHKKDDDSKGHKGLYGDKCETCHSATNWKDSSFNHDTETKYALRGKHRGATCVSCHTGALYRNKLSQTCIACHQKDDKHKETLGKECGNCHTEKNWKESPKFDHQKTSFPLLGKHLQTDCKACHKSALYKEAPSSCIGCHKKDDKHEGDVGDQCQQCHQERDWKLSTQLFQHDKTRFKLRNAHAEPVTKCNACHKDLKSYRKTPTDCMSCHKKDDKHEGQQGPRCDECHNDKNWKDTRFDHSLSRFPLLGKHISLVCKSCHATPRYKDAAKDCFSCHKKDDKHLLKFGTACESCHNARAWSIWKFDHDLKTSYKLEGLHRKVKCESCHKAPAPSGKAARSIGTGCINCHREADVHDGQFGRVCEQCHTTEGWKKTKRRFAMHNDKG